MGQDAVKILAALGDDGGQANDLGAGAYDDQELELAVILKFDVGIV
jgi:hypothetical protein